MHWIVQYLLALMVLRMSAVPFSDEEIALAQIMQGEANRQFMHDAGQSAYCVGWVVRNWIAADKCESYADCQGYFNGTITRAPQWRYLALARLVMNNTDDPTGGALYVLSKQDMDKLDFDESQASLVMRASPERGLFFFKTWPGGAPTPSAALWRFLDKSRATTPYYTVLLYPPLVPSLEINWARAR